MQDRESHAKPLPLRRRHRHYSAGDTLMRNINPVFCFISFLIITFSCSNGNNELNEKQAELDRNRSLWESKGMSHYRYVEFPNCGECGYDISIIPRNVFISNRMVYSTILYTNDFSEQDFVFISNDYIQSLLISNTYEFISPRGRIINYYFDAIQNFINNIKNDTSINHLSGYHDYTIEVIYNQEYGYPTKIYLSKAMPSVVDGNDYPLITNLQILD